MTDYDIKDIIERLRAQGADDDSIEVKSCQSELGKAVWESVSAFANTSGGILILGLDEATGFHPVPNFQLDKVLNQFHAGMSEDLTGQKVRPVPRYDLKRATFEGQQVVVIQILEVEEKPCFVIAKGMEAGSYRRLDDKDLHLSSNDIYELKHAKVLVDTDRQPVPGTGLLDLDEAELQAYIETMVRERPRSVAGVSDEAERLRRLNVTTSTNGVTLAALLTLGKYPQQYFPRLTVEVTAYPGSEKSEADQEVRFTDRQICEGRAPELIEEAIRVVTRNLRTIYIVKDTHRQNEPEIPLNVLREAIANAVVHREYDARFVAEPITIEVFSNRLEIRSPGGLWGGRTVENLGDGVTQQRNQSLMTFLSNTPAAQRTGFTVEGAGSGIPLMINELRSRSLPAPQFKVTPSSTTVIFRRHGVEHAENRVWAEELVGRELKDAELVALLDARENGVVTVDQLRTKMAIDSGDARRILSHLQNERVLTETHPDVFDFNIGSALPTETEQEILAILHTKEGLGIQQISTALGKTANTLRPHIRNLVNSGYVEAHGNLTSRKRTYTRTSVGDSSNRH